MANHTHSSSGGSSFQMDIDISDFTDEITQGIKLAIHRALIRIGGEVVTYAGKLIHNVTGNLQRSLTYYVEGDSVYVGTNCEYAQFVEEGTSRARARPYLRPAAEGHMDEWRRILEEELETGG